MLRQFIVDNDAEKNEIDVSQLSPGSTVQVIATGVTYILNQQLKWVVKEEPHPGPDPEVTYIYDGGEII